MAEPAPHFRAILERPHDAQRLLSGALIAVALYAALLVGAIVLSRRVVTPPRAPRSSLVVTLLDAPQTGLPRSTGEVGSAASAAPGSERGRPRLIGPERRAMRTAALPDARPEPQPKALPSDRREDGRGVAAKAQGSAGVPVGDTVAPTAAVAASAATASVGARGAGAAGSAGSSLTSGTGTGSGSGVGAAGARSGTGDQPGLASGDTEVLPFRDGMTRPSLLEKVDPTFTREARDANVSGLILTKCVITTSGALRACRIVKGIPSMDEAVLKALAKWRYTPVVYQGRAVAVEYVIPVRLMLQ